MSRELSLSQLTTELTDFLGLPADLDLPPLRTVSCKRSHNDDNWSVEASVAGNSDTQRYEAIRAWAAFAGGTVQIGSPYAASHQPCGMQRTLTVRIVVAEVPIVLLAGVDAMFTVPLPPLTADERAAEDEISAATQWGPVAS